MAFPLQAGTAVSYTHLDVYKRQDEFDLIKLESQQFQSLLVEMKNDWNHLKTEIHKYRSGLDNQTLFEMSEDYFELADNTVLVAENYIEERVQSARCV